MDQMETQPAPRRRDRDAYVGGLVLIIIGAALLIAQFTPDLGRYVVLVIGIGLLAIFAVNRAYGALIGGAIVTGVGAGIIIGASTTGSLAGSAVLLSLGVGFIGIWLVSYLLNIEGRHWWPLVPGLILLSIGGALVIGGRATDLLAYWPVILIAVGVLVIGSQILRRGTASADQE
jgi:hypothetical protein